MTRAVRAAVAFTLAAPVAAGALTLSLPIDCTLGESCYIQQFADRDPGPDVMDFRCGPLTYDGHKGTDFALRSAAAMARGVNVLAAETGIVAGARDGMPDTGFTPETAPGIKGRECGNGVVLRHGDGWETQYCHMKSGTVQVAKGDRVERGTVLGQVGLSGHTEFPHVHLSVRKDGQVVDPFDIAPSPSCDAVGETLWDVVPPYVPGGLISVGFSPDVPSYDAIRDGTAAHQTLGATAGGLVLFGYAFGGQAGDTMALHVTGPEGEVFAETAEVEKNQAQFFRATGRRLTAARWPAGTYRGTVQLQRGETVLDQKTVEVKIE